MMVAIRYTRLKNIYCNNYDLKGQNIEKLSAFTLYMLNQFQKYCYKVDLIYTQYRFIFSNMRSNRFTGIACNLKHSFDEYIGFPFLVFVCFLSCIFSPSIYWLAACVIVKIGSKQMWIVFKPWFIYRQIGKICKRHFQIQTNGRAQMSEALKGTKFDKDSLELIPTRKQAILILVKLKEYRLALELIQQLQSQQKKKDSSLEIIKQFISNASQNNNEKLSQSARVVGDNLEKLIKDISHNKLKANTSDDAISEYIPKKWMADLSNYAFTGKTNKQLYQTEKSIKKFSNQKDRIKRFTNFEDPISNLDSYYQIPKEDLPLFYNLFANKPLELPEIKVQVNNRGLANLGSTCYMNTALQCLHKTFQLTTKIKETKSSSYFVKTYLQLMQELSANANSPFRPKQMKKMIGQYNPIFDDYKQHDAGELLSTVLNYLSDELNTVSQRQIYRIDASIKRSDDQLLQQYIKRDRHRSHSIIDDLVFGRFLTEYQCCQCGGKMKLFQKFNVLYLPVPMKPELNLTICMQEFMLAQRMDGQNAWWCPTCEADTSTNKFMSVYQHSPILIICLKRFIDGRKIRNLIEFDRQIKLSDISKNPETKKVNYDLFGVINHSGNSLDYGHYYSYCLDGFTWREYNDSSVQEISQQQLVTANAFLLLYRESK